VRRKNATRESTSTLKAWLYEHIKNPYPTKGEKIMLAIITKMTLTQVARDNRSHTLYSRQNTVILARSARLPIRLYVLYSRRHLVKAMEVTAAWRKVMAAYR